MHAELQLEVTKLQIEGSSGGLFPRRSSRSPRARGDPPGRVLQEQVLLMRNMVSQLPLLNNVQQRMHAGGNKLGGFAAVPFFVAPQPSKPEILSLGQIA